MQIKNQGKSMSAAGRGQRHIAQFDLEVLCLLRGEQDRVIAALGIPRRGNNGLHFLRTVGRDEKARGHKLYPVGGGTGRTPGSGEYLLVFFVVPEIGDLDAHLHRVSAFIGGCQTELKGHSWFEFLPHLARRQTERLRRSHGRPGRNRQQEQNRTERVMSHHGTVIVKVRVALSLPVNAPGPLLVLETNRPRKRVMATRSDADAVICTGVPVIWVNGPVLAPESSNCSTVG